MTLPANARLVQPVTGGSFSETTLESYTVAAPLALGALARCKDAGLTVYAPPSPPAGLNGAFAVYDDSGGAALSPIVISSQTGLIDGAATFSLDVNNGIAVFVSDGTSGNWRSVQPEYQFEGGAGRTTSPLAPVAAVVAAQSQQIVSLADIGKNGGAAWTAGTYTYGSQFITHKELTILGVRAFVRYASGGARTLRASIWSSVGAARLASVDVAAVAGAGAGAIVDFTFAVPLVLPPTPVGQKYFATVYDTTGGEYCAQAPGPSQTYLWQASQPALRPFVLYRGTAYAVNDACPTSFLNVATTEFAPIDPIVDE